MSAALSVLLWAGTAAATTREEAKRILTPPADSLEAERVRIRFDSQRPNSCLVVVTIHDDSNRVVRELVNAVLPGGHYSFYWDKKKDNGEFVQSGVYRYRVNDCDKSSYGQVTAQFKLWERFCRLCPVKGTERSTLCYELLSDSALVSIRLYNKAGVLVDRPVCNAFKNKGRYNFHWMPGRTITAGKYNVELTIGDHTIETELLYRPTN